MMPKTTLDKVKKASKSKLWIRFGVIAYEILVIVLLYKELNASSMRATDPVFVLLGFLFLPAVLLAVGRAVKASGSVFVKAGNIEVRFEDLEKQVAQTDQKIETKAKQLEQQLEEHLTGKLSSAEQTLYPIIGGPDAFARERLDRGHLIIGSKDFAANIVVAELLAQHLELAGLQCERRIPNGGTVTNYACLVNGWIDLFVDYTGTGCLFLNIKHHGKSESDILRLLNDMSKKRFKFEWLKPLGTKTNYCIVMQEPVAAQKEIEYISDLSDHERGRLCFCGNYEFMNRTDGFLGLANFYNLRFAKETVCAYGDRYNSLIHGDADLTVGHTTDPEISSMNLRVLKDRIRGDNDGKGFFPDYLEVPVARTEALEVVDGLRQSLNEFSELGIENKDLSALILDYRDNRQALGDQVRSLLSQKRRLKQI